MMTIHKLSAGDGYRYYTRETATADAAREGSRELGDYYTAGGNPPGVWVGSGTALLGVTGTVTEAQMKALFGEGLHPDAERIIAEHLAAGDKPKQALAAARLGRRYYQYETKDGEFGRRLGAAMADLERREHRPVSPEEQTALRGRVGAQMFRERHGRNPLGRAELGQFITAQGDKGSTAVAGFDLVFSAPKSVSVLWGLGDEATRVAVERAHEQAIADTLGWIEQHALMTRTGINGVAQEDVQGGLVATRFRHYDSRSGDPMLHDHVVLANKVKGQDGKWRSIDGTLLMQMNVPASEHYNQRVIEYVATALDLAAEAREVTPGKRPVMELAGVDAELIEAHSRRSTDINARMDELLRAYVAEHGYEPSDKARLRLLQQATLNTRPDKEHAKPLAELRASWRADAVAMFGPERVDQLLQRAQQAAAPARSARPDVDVDQLAAAALEAVSDHRAVWRRSHVLAEARRQVMAATKGAWRADGLAEEITDRALSALSIDITPPDPNPVFAPLTRADGTSVYRRKGSELYTSAAVLAAEDTVVAAAKSPAIPAVAGDVFDRVLAAHTGPLDPGQQRLARAFATGEQLLVAGIGPAGAGKTSALRLVADAVRAQGGRVIGLGPSARAAQVMAGEIQTDAFTVHEWLAQRQRTADGARVEDRYRLRPGDVVIVDEAGMAGTRRLAHAVDEARRAGAHVRLIGDPAQLAAIESGGVLRLLAQQGQVVELESVHRFQTPGEGAASLLLRDGDPEQAFAWYQQHGRIVGGTYEQMVDGLFTRWQLDTEARQAAMMMAEDNITVADLNTRAQAWRMSRGQLDPGPAAPLRDDQHAYAGDLVVTRQNRRKLKLRGGKDFVKNGDVWTVQDVHRDGSATVRHTDHGGRIRLDAAYLRDHAQLGYASTGHRGQGATVDAGSGLASGRTSRESAYVMLTRGRGGNRLFLVLDKGESVDDALARIARNSQASRSAHETIRAEQDRAWGIGQLTAEYTDAHARALGQRYQALARHALGDQAAEMFIAAEAWPAVERALRDAELTGFDPETILTTAVYERDFSDAEDNSAVLSWRIDRRVEEGAEARERAAELDAERPGNRPLADYATDRLDELADQTRAQRAQALLELQQAEARVAAQPRPVTAFGLPHPAWPDRRHGGLTRTELADHLAGARRDARRPGDPEQAQAAMRRAAELRTEQRLRRALPPLDRAREDWQREISTAPAGIPERITQLHDVDRAQSALQRADVIADQVAAEQRLRTKLPDLPADAPALQTDHTGPVPTWLAPVQAQADPRYTPTDWRDHLDLRRDVMGARLQQTGQTLAADTPTWARPLGPVPPADHPLHDRWQHLAALVDAWRVRTQTPATSAGLGPEPADPHQAEAWRALQADIDDMGRRARGIAAAQQRRDGLDPDQLQPAPAPDADGPEQQPARTGGWRSFTADAPTPATETPGGSWRNAPGQNAPDRDRERRRRDDEQQQQDQDQAPER